MGKQCIGILIYANPDHYPPTVNAVHLLSKYFNIVLIGRNQDPSNTEYPSNVIVHRLGQYTTVKEREQMSAKAKLWEYIQFIIQARKLLKNVSLVYAYDPFGYTAAYLCQIGRFQSVPLVYHNHDLSVQLLPISTLSGWIQRAEKRWVNHASFVVFPSQARALLFQKITNFTGKILILPNFPRKSFFKANSQIEKIIIERFRKPQILLQGTISVENSMLEIINSLSFLEDFIELKLIGPIKEEHHSLMIDFVTRKNFLNRVNYCRPVPYDELPSHTWMASVGICLYKKLDINHQTMGTASNKIYEYAACGLPIVVSNLPNYVESLSCESWVRFADPDNSNSIASAIQDILKDFQKYKEMCLESRKAFEEKYNYESAFTALLSTIEKLV